MVDFNAMYRRCLFWLRDYFKGSPIRSHYVELKKIQESSFDECKELRNSKLRSLLIHAQENSKFYSEIKSLEIKDFPVVNKVLLREKFDEVRVAYDKIPGQRGDLHIQTTSGSTGIPFAVPQDTNKRNRRIAELKYYGKVVGFNSHEKLIHLRTWNRWQFKTPCQIKNENIIPFDISNMGDDRLRELCELIKDSKAICLRGYASSFDILAEYVKNNEYVFPKLKIIIAGSEMLHEDTRYKVKKYLRCEIISQYANEECGILAQEKVPTDLFGDVMYMNHASYYFEILKLDSDTSAEYGELGRIVVTDLTNYAFPIIRYDTGDLGIMQSADKFSKGYPILIKLYGRRLDVCYTTYGEPFSPMTIGRILKHFDSILQWQFIQKAETEYTLRVVRRLSYAVDELSIINTLKEQIGENAIINVEYVNDIPVLSSGKRKPVVNEWKNAEL